MMDENLLHYTKPITIKDGKFSKTVDDKDFKDVGDTNLESNSLVAEANNRRKKQESIRRDKSFSSLVRI